MNLYPEIAHFFSDHIYAKQMQLAKGKKVKSHKHEYSHLSILAKGRVEIECDGVTTFYAAPACIEIKAGVEHSIYANQTAIFYCVHAFFDDVDKEHFDEVSIMGIKE